MNYKICTEWALCFSLLVSSVASEYTWWADQSCNIKFGDDGETLDTIMEEAFKSASMSWDRMSQSRTDQPEAWETFQTMLHYEPDITGELAVYWKYYKYIVTTLKRFFKEFDTGDAGRKASEIRVYCDNDDRMELVADDATMYENLPANTPVNSERDADHQEWDDPINKVRSIGLPGCKEEFSNGDVVSGNVHGMIVRYGDDPEENEHRVSITICDAWLNLEHRVNTWEMVDLNGLPNDQTRNQVDNLKYVGSHLMYHELMHHSRFVLQDRKPGYTWDDMMALPPMMAATNAETHATAASLMRLLDDKLKLEMVDGRATGSFMFDESIRARVPAAAKKKRSAVTCENGNTAKVEGGLVCKEFAG